MVEQRTEPWAADEPNLTRGEADDLLLAAYQAGRMTADEDIADLREELHAAWSDLAAAREQKRETR